MSVVPREPHGLIIEKACHVVVGSLVQRHYEDANYLGVSAQITSDIRDLKSFTGPCFHDIEYGAIYDWNDCVSSIHVAPGWRAIVFRDDDFSGQRLEVTADVPNLQRVPGSCNHDGLNDCITSIKVFAP